MILWDSRVGKKGSYKVPKEIAEKDFYSRTAFNIACWSMDLFFSDYVRSKELLKKAYEIEARKLKRDGLAEHLNLSYWGENAWRSK